MDFYITGDNIQFNFAQNFIIRINWGSWDSTSWEAVFLLSLVQTGIQQLRCSYGATAHLWPVVRTANISELSFVPDDQFVFFTLMTQMENKGAHLTAVSFKL